jgi:hypothetical protein
MKERRIRWVGLVAHLREKKSTEFWVEHLKEGDCVMDEGIDGTLILKWVLKTCVGCMDWIN